MIVVVEEAVFTSLRTTHMELVEVFRFGLEGRHRVQVDPVFRAEGRGPVHDWIEDQSRELQDEISLALEAGIEEEVRGIPADHTVRIADIQAPEWNAEPPRLPLGTGMKLLRQPLKLYLENHIHDRAFLETVALGRWRKELRRAFEQGLVEPAHGGGLTEMKKTAEARAPHPGSRLRHWFLFDSDAWEPGRPSKHSEELRATCEGLGYPHHQLERRASENYLPSQALHGWASLARTGQQRDRQKKVEAFGAMEPVQRHHYNMKRGFQGDQKDQSQEIPELFGDLPKREPELRIGFGPDIGKLYQEFDFPDRWLVQDDQRDETNRILQGIFRAL